MNAPAPLPRLPVATTLHTPRLNMVVWRDHHLAALAAMNADPEVMRYFPATQDLAQSRASLQAWQAQFAEQGWSNWAVERRDTGEFIGFVGLSVPRRVLPFTPCVEIGWRLARPHWHQGLASEAAQAALALAFSQLGMDEIVSFTALLNVPSRAVMTRIGMTDTGRNFDHPALPDGHALRPHCLYAITRQQWLASGARPVL